MNVFINWLQKEITGISENHMSEPADAAFGCDVVICEITDPDIRKLYALNTRLGEDIYALCEAEEVERAHIVIRGDDHRNIRHNPSTCSICKIKRQVGTVHQRKEAVDSIMWSCIADGLSEENVILSQKLIAEGCFFKICVGWKLVARRRPILSSSTMFYSLMDVVQLSP